MGLETNLYSSFSSNCKFRIVSNSEVEVVKLEEKENSNEEVECADIGPLDAGKWEERRVLFIPVVEQTCGGTPSLNGTSKETNDGEKCVCVICKKLLGSKKTLRAHLLTHSVQKNFACQVCNKKFALGRQLKNHTVKCEKRSQRIGERKNPNYKAHTCEVCGKVINKSYLKRHMLVHAAYRFTCDICENKFKSQAYLERHKCKGKPCCSICSMEFISWKEVRAHAKTHEKTPDVKPDFKCFHCEKVFPDNSKLKRHLMTHSDDKPFSCDVCHKKFTRRDHLTRHKKLHSKYTSIQDVNHLNDQENII